MAELVQISDGDAKQRRDDANILRGIADRVESGDITNFVIVANNRAEYVFESVGSFRDRWHILGALEHAKQSVYDN